ncbi:MAG: hypothetical protein RID07_08650, partial [Lacipirellulaceae bacterium]
MITTSPSSPRKIDRTLRMEQFEGRLVLSAATAVDLSALDAGVLDHSFQLTQANLTSLIGIEGGLVDLQPSGSPRTAGNGFDLGSFASDQAFVPGLTNGSTTSGFGQDLDLDGSLNLGIGGGVRPFPGSGGKAGEGGSIVFDPPPELPALTGPAPAPTNPEHGDPGQDKQSIAQLVDRPLENVRVRASWLEVASTENQRTSSATHNQAHTEKPEVRLAQLGQFRFQQHRPTPRQESPTDVTAHTTRAIHPESQQTSVTTNQLTEQTTAEAAEHLPTKRSPTTPTERPANILPEEEQTPRDQAARQAAFDELEASPRFGSMSEATPDTAGQQPRISTEQHPHLYGIALVALLSADHFLRRHSQTETTTA